MPYPAHISSWLLMLMIACLAWLQTGCVRGIPAEHLASAEAYDYDYVIGAGDTLNVFVWGVPELSQEEATVRPDGRISLPLVEDLMASGKTPTQLARELERALAQYVREPLVTVLVGDFQGVFDTQIRVIGEVGGAGAGTAAGAGGRTASGGGGVGTAAGGTGTSLITPQPKAIAYTMNMTLLDVMIRVGGLTPFAAGNRAKLIRTVDGKRHQYRVRLKDLVEGGDLSANVKMAPGDILIVPTAWL